MVQKAKPDVLHLIDFGAAVKVGTPQPAFENGWRLSYLFVSAYRTLRPYDSKSSGHSCGNTLTLLMQGLPWLMIWWLWAPPWFTWGTSIYLGKPWLIHQACQIMLAVLLAPNFSVTQKLFARGFLQCFKIFLHLFWVSKTQIYLQQLSIIATPMPSRILRRQPEQNEFGCVLFVSVFNILVNTCPSDLNSYINVRDVIFRKQLCCHQRLDLCLSKI